MPILNFSLHLKKRIVFIVLSAFLFSSYLSAQEDSLIVVFNTSSVDSLKKDGDLQGALLMAKSFFESDPYDYDNIYVMACLFAVMSEKDSSFYYLTVLSKSDSSFNPLGDPDFIKLYEDTRWNHIETFVANRLNRSLKLNNINYAKALWRLLAKDQVYYSEIRIADKLLGVGNSISVALFDYKRELDNKNLKTLEVLIEKYGWPRLKDVGESASSAAFLIVQHSSLSTQKRHLQILSKLCDEKEIDCSNYAMLIDRVLINEGKKQVYGTQLRWDIYQNKFIPLDIENESEVDDRRQKLGLDKLSEYLKEFNTD